MCGKYFDDIQVYLEMNLRLLLIAGNGLSIAMHRQKPVDGIDLINLFKKGGDVAWPATGHPGFLSYEHCPALWALGARQTVSAEAAYSVIEQTITAVNACCLADPSSLEDSIYVRAYKELVAYLRYLFVHYDRGLINAGFFEEESSKKPIDWLFKAVNAPGISDIDVVTFNYDAFLERSLQQKGVGFSIPLLSESPTAKIRLHKPHGSITFCGKTSIDRSAFKIKYEQGTFSEGDIDSISVKYDELDENYPMFGMLPPAGDSDRYQHRWIKQIWNKADEAVKNLQAGDLVVLYGLSYWHVDRREIDSLLTKVNRSARVISINPNPNPHFEAVCCSLFKAYHSYADSAQLAKVIP